MSQPDVKIVFAVEGAEAVKAAAAGVRSGLDGIITVASRAVLGLGVLAGAVLAAKAAFGAAVEQAAKYQDIAERIGDTAENIASIGVAAGAAGVGMEAIESASLRLTKALVGVDDESKDAGAAIKALGLEVDAVKNAAPIDRLEMLAKAFDRFRDGPQKAAVAMALWRMGGAAMLPLMKELAAEESRRNILTGEQIERADAYLDRQNKQRAVMQAYVGQIGAEALPAIEALTGAIADMAKGLLDADKAGDDLQLSQVFAGIAYAGASALAVVAESIGGIIKAAQAVSGSFKVVLADLEVIAANAPGMAAKRLIIGGESLQSILERRNKTVAEANKAYADLWDYDGRAISKAIDAAFDKAAQAQARGKLQGFKKTDDRPQIDFAGGANTGGAKQGPVAKDPTTAAQNELAQYVKALERVIEKEQELSEIEKAGNFLAGLGKLGQVPQVRELVFDMAAKADYLKATKEIQEEEARAAAEYKKAAEARVKLDDEAIASTERRLEQLNESNRRAEDELELLGLDDKARRRILQARADEAVAVAQSLLDRERESGVSEARIRQMERELELRQQAAGITAQRNITEGIIDEKKTSERLTDSITEGIMQGFRNGRTLGDIFLNELQAQFAKAVLQPMIRPVADAASSGISSIIASIASAIIPGRHAEGLSYVPYDNYLALLHRGERVVRADAAASAQAAPRVPAGAGAALSQMLAGLVGPMLPGHAEGLAYVPHDNYMARLHRGERVVRADAAASAQHSGPPITVVQNFTVGDVATIDVVRQAVKGSEARMRASLMRSQRFGGAMA